MLADYRLVPARNWEKLSSRSASVDPKAKSQMGVNLATFKEIEVMSHLSGLHGLALKEERGNLGQIMLDQAPQPVRAHPVRIFGSISPLINRFG